MAILFCLWYADFDRGKGSADVFLLGSTDEFSRRLHRTLGRLSFFFLAYLSFVVVFAGLVAKVLVPLVGMIGFSNCLNRDVCCLLQNIENIK